MKAMTHSDNKSSLPSPPEASTLVSHRPAIPSSLIQITISMHGQALISISTARLLELSHFTSRHVFCCVHRRFHLFSAFLLPAGKKRRVLPVGGSSERSAGRFAGTFEGKRLDWPGWELGWNGRSGVCKIGSEAVHHKLMTAARSSEIAIQIPYKIKELHS